MQLSSPNLIIPGAAKSGTSSLHEYLNFHPDIFMSENKEPHFFNDDNKYFNDQEFEAYIESFRDGVNCKIRGESSTGYFVFKNTFLRIKEKLGENVKFILLLRNPVDRAYSHYWWLKGVGNESKSFLDAINFDKNQEPDYRLALNGGNFKFYFQFGLYAKWLKEYLNCFKSENILIITSEELRADKLGTLNKCFSFFGSKRTK